jgi:hypothetical protein
MKTFAYNLVLDDWKISSGTCKGKTKKSARAKLYARIKRRGKFKKMRGELIQVV